jgi:hypothetical protein
MMWRNKMMGEKEMGADRGVVVAGAVTARDLEMLRWISKVRFATVEQVCARFAMHSTKAYRRLKPLRELGLLQRDTLLHHQSGCYSITRRGLKALLVSDMSVPRVSLQTYLHDEAVVWEQIAFELRDCEVVTEREMRRRARSSGESFLVRIPSTHKLAASSHRPDLVVRMGDAWHAVEVELSLKSESRLSSILAGYLSAEQYASVVYCVPGSEYVARVRRAGDALGLGRRLKVVTVSDRAAA